jgi:BolA protein
MDPELRRVVIESNLIAAFAPGRVEVADESLDHMNHAGHGGRGHYAVLIVSERFAGLSPVARHRLVYEALGDLMRTDIHALAIQALSPAECEEPGATNGGSGPEAPGGPAGGPAAGPAAGP